MAVTKPGFVPATTSETFNNGNQLTAYGSEAITYDTNGNRLSDGQFTYTWNAADQLIAVTRKGETTAFATYKYDDDGSRIEKIVNGTTTRFYYDGDIINILYETDANGTILRQYVYNVDGVRMAMKSQGQILYYHYNPHGDVIAMTDQNGNVVAKYDYDAWGNVISPNVTGIAAENPFGYAGYMYDKETSMYYLTARYYHPKHGVFISVDPDPGDEDDPITQNGYTYTNNNPVMNVDPDGHFFWLAVNAGFAAYDGYKAYKKGGWKVAAIAGGAPLVGGVAFKAYKAYQAYRFAKNYKKMSLVARYSYQKYQANGWKKLAGYSKVKKYHNKSKPYLPRIRKNYKEYDAAGYVKGARGSERFVVHHGRFGKKRVYYTPSHYRSWKRIK